MRFLLILLTGLTILSPLQAQQWTKMANIPQGRHHPVTWGINGVGYMVTGTNAQNNPTKTFYTYNPQTDRWNYEGLFPGTERSFAIGTVYKGKGYLGFGASQTRYLNDLWEYDPATDSWNQLASCPCAGRRHPSFVASNDAIYVGLGDGAQGNYDDWWKYDMKADSWRSIPDLPGAGRHHPFQFVVNGQVYAGMGHAGQVIFDDWYRLDTATDTWTQMDDFPGEARVAGTQFNHAQQGYVLSGDGDNHSYMSTGEFWRYNDSTDTWTQLTAHPGVSRWAPGSFVLNDEVYLIGGLNRQTRSLASSIYKYPLPSTVSLKETPQEPFTLYPNPTQGSMTIQAEREFDALTLINSTGVKVFQKKGTFTKVDLGSLSPGIYLAQLRYQGTLLGQQRILKR